MTGIQLDWNDVWSNIAAIKSKLILIAIVVVAIIALVILAKKFFKEKGTRTFFRLEALLCGLLCIVSLVDSILLNEERELLNSVFAEFDTLSEESIENSRATIEEVADEGIVLLGNRNLPFSDLGNINVFGWASTNPVYGGTGSGTVNAETAVSVIDGLKNAGFNINEELSDFYAAYRDSRPAITINEGQDWTLPEPTIESYSDELLSDAKSFSDTAIIFIARCGGEGADMPKDMGGIATIAYNEEVPDEPWLGSDYYQGTKYTKAYYKNNGDYNDFEAGDSYLQLSKTEENLVDYVCNNYDNVVIVYNGSNVFELDWVENYESISGVLICPSAGLTGFSSLGNIIAGNVNPSGKTVDTWVNDVTLTPTYNNSGSFFYDNVGDITEAAYNYVYNAYGMTNVDKQVSFINYTEGIYVGYKFYETAYVESFGTEEEEGFDWNYDEVVSYPFGYGESYTTFDQTLDSLTENNGAITATVTVTNTGDVAGKSVVELYYTPPYINGGIEKAAVNLISFDKTDILSPGESQTMTLTFDAEDMASFDTYGTGYYVLEKGDYVISLRSDAHTVIAEQTWSLDSTIIYDESATHNDDEAVATVQMSDAEGLDYITYLSRADHFANYDEATAAPTDYSVHTDVTLNGNYDVYEYNNEDDVMPITGADNGIDLVDLRGVDYDDELWDQLLNELTVDEMVTLISKGGWQTAAVSSINKIATIDSDGPAGITYALSDGATGSGYCGEILLAMTWNVDLAAKLADGIAQEMLDMGVNGWYAPSMNMHRTVFGGRNFEYYSEDSTLSAAMAVAECEAVYAYGVVPYIKHFAFNEQETNRNGAICTWLTEQSAREIYLKPFEEVLKSNAGATNGETIAVMSSYVYVGSTWDAAYEPLMKTILREEWGFEGLVITDYFGDYGYMDADKAIRGGTDMMLVAAETDNIPTDTSSATSVIAMRNSCHDILYTVVNSNAFSEENYSEAVVTASWILTLRNINIILGIVFIFFQALIIINYLKERKNSTSAGQGANSN